MKLNLKTQLTKQIEQALVTKYCGGNFKQNYGAIEVPTSYQLGRGKENVDFAMYAPRTQDVSCYEIKISKDDFNSQASLSFCGNKNYLVAEHSLAEYLLTNWHNHKIVDTWTHKDLAIHGVGLIEYKDGKLNTLIQCKRREIHLENKVALIEGILRAGCRDAEKAYNRGLFL